MDRKQLRAIKDDLLFIGPGVTFFAGIVLVSFVLGIYYSFTEWNGVDKEAIWIGIQNYIEIFSGDKQAGVSALFTARFTIASVLIANLLAFVLALALTRALKTDKILRTIIFLQPVGSRTLTQDLSAKKGRFSGTWIFHHRGHRFS